MRTKNKDGSYRQTANCGGARPNSGRKKASRDTITTKQTQLTFFSTKQNLRQQPEPNEELEERNTEHVELGEDQLSEANTESVVFRPATPPPTDSSHFNSILEAELHNQQRLEKEPIISDGESAEIDDDEAEEVEEGLEEGHDYVKNNSVADSIISTFHYKLKSDTSLESQQLKKGILWFMPEMNVKEAKPETYCQMTIFHFDPILSFGIKDVRCIHCPSKRVYRKGFPSNPRARYVVGIDEVFLLSGYRYACTDCSKTFYSTNPSFLETLPLFIQVQFPCLITNRLAIDKRFGTMLFELAGQLIGPNLICSLIHKLHRNRYHQRLLSYLSHALMNKKQSALDRLFPKEYPKFPEYDDKYSYNGPKVSVTFIAKLLIAIVENRKPFLDKLVSLETFTVLKFDTSFNTLPKIMDSKNYWPAGTLNCLQEYSFSKGSFMCPDESRETYCSIFKPMNTNNQACGVDIQFIISDRCCQDQSVLEECFPPLRKDAGSFPSLEDPYPHSSATTSSLPLFAPTDYEMVYVNCSLLLDSIADIIDANIKYQLSIGITHPVIFVDSEWDVFGDYSRVLSVIQIGLFENPEARADDDRLAKTILIHLPKCLELEGGKWPLPTRLKQILQSSEIVKVGMQLSADKSMFQKYLGFEMKPTLEITHFLNGRGYQVNTLSLQNIMKKVLKLHLDKSYQVSNAWYHGIDDGYLNQEQCRYASYDVLAVKECFVYGLQKPILTDNIKANQTNSPVNTKVLLLKSHGKSNAAVEPVAKGTIVSVENQNQWHGERLSAARLKQHRFVLITEVINPHATIPYPYQDGNKIINDLGSFMDANTGNPVLLVKINGLALDKTHHYGPFQSMRLIEADQPMDQVSSEGGGIKAKRILLDLWHALDRVGLSKNHPGYKIFNALLSLVLRPFHPGDLQQYILLRKREEESKGKGIHNEALYVFENIDDASKHCRRYGPPPHVIVPASYELYHEYKNMVNPLNNETLFDEKKSQNFENLMLHVKKGCLSFPPNWEDTDLVLQIGEASNGLPIWKRNCATSEVEGTHQKTAAAKTWNAGPRLWTTLLTCYRVNHYSKARVIAKGFKGCGHSDMSLLDTQQALSEVLWEEPTPLNWENTNNITLPVVEDYDIFPVDPDKSKHVELSIGDERINHMPASAQYIAVRQKALAPYKKVSTNEEKSLFSKLKVKHIKSNKLDVGALTNDWNNFVLNTAEKTERGVKYFLKTKSHLTSYDNELEKRHAARQVAGTVHSNTPIFAKSVYKVLGLSSSNIIRSAGCSDMEEPPCDISETQEINSEDRSAVSTPLETFPSLSDAGSPELTLPEPTEQYTRLDVAINFQRPDTSSYSLPSGHLHATSSKRMKRACKNCTVPSCNGGINRSLCVLRNPAKLKPKASKTCTNCFLQECYRTNGGAPYCKLCTNCFYRKEANHVCHGTKNEEQEIAYHNRLTEYKELKNKKRREKRQNATSSSN